MPLHEAMACGIPSIAGYYSALAEWPIDTNGPGVFYIPVTDTPDAITSGANTIHRSIDMNAAIQALEFFYQNKQARNDFGSAGFRVATQPKFSWWNISQQFDSLFQQLLRKED